MAGAPVPSDPSGSDLQRRMSRRSFVKGAIGLGLSLPAVGGLLAACSNTAPAAAPAADIRGGSRANRRRRRGRRRHPGLRRGAHRGRAGPGRRPARSPPWRPPWPLGRRGRHRRAGPSGAGKTFKVSILDKEMTKDEVVAALKKEGEVNVANWTYTANDAIVGRFQDVVKEEWGVDIKCNYLPSQSPSVYLTNLYTANKAGNPAPYDADGHRGAVLRRGQDQRRHPGHLPVGPDEELGAGRQALQARQRRPSASRPPRSRWSCTPRTGSRSGRTWPIRG